MLIGEFFQKSEKGQIKLDYRPAFMSLIKQAIENFDSDLLGKWFGKQTVKPFTFAVCFGKGIKIEGDKLLFNGNFHFKFNSADKLLLSAVHNYLQELRSSGESYPIGEDDFLVSRIDLRSPPEIKDEVVFQTISPVLIRSFDNPDYYLLPATENHEADEHFDRDFVRNLEEQITNLNCYLGSKEVDFGLEEYEFEHGKRVIVKHMNQKHPDSKPLKFPGFQGKIKLNAPSSVLRLLYQAGIGARRSQGFGMVDIKS